MLRVPIGKVLGEHDIAGEETQMHFVALEGDAVVGCVIMKPLSPTRAKLRQMAVADALQGQGIGQQLVAYAEAHLRAAGVTTIETAARKTAEGFYARQGYIPEGAPYELVGLHTLTMVKAL